MESTWHSVKQRINKFLEGQRKIEGQLMTISGLVHEWAPEKKSLYEIYLKGLRKSTASVQSIYDSITRLEQLGEPTEITAEKVTAAINNGTLHKEDQTNFIGTDRNYPFQPLLEEALRWTSHCNDLLSNLNRRPRRG